MAKYSADFKLKIVQEYLKGGIGYGALAHKYGISSKKCIQHWVRKYQVMGKKDFSGQEKMNPILSNSSYML